MQFDEEQRKTFELLSLEVHNLDNAIGLLGRVIEWATGPNNRHWGSDELVITRLDGGDLLEVESDLLVVEGVVLKKQKFVAAVRQFREYLEIVAATQDDHPAIRPDATYSPEVTQLLTAPPRILREERGIQPRHPNGLRREQFPPGAPR